MSLLIGNNLVVSMHYKLTDNSGNLLDSSEGGDPLTYLHGAGNIIPGLESALTGKVAGDSVQATVAPQDAYGESRPEMIQVVPRSAFQGVEEIEPGMSFQAQGQDGAVQRITVTAVDGENITVDGNHPLAGVELNFDVEIVTVREATEEELSHGHVHG
ncbi:MAG: peptidylprolyl isomerase [Halioglobus sp.]|nr:peptidylprolyl isomerase [Halioglobus sp.]|tara:strand:- start:2097 stop:2570 length:474 start_codon:yes stop_codon:yes gene_type:complete